MTPEERATEAVVDHLLDARDALEAASDAAENPYAAAKFRASSHKIDAVIRSYRQTGRLLDSLGVDP